MSHHITKRSKLELYVSERLFFALTFIEVRENDRPRFIFDYCGRWLELDFYIPQLKVAIEVQGIQHYEHVPFFHPTVEDFEERQKTDALKRLVCDKHGIWLYEVFDELSADYAVEEIKKKHERLCQVSELLPPLSRVDYSTIEDEIEAVKLEFIYIHQLHKLPFRGMYCCYNAEARDIEWTYDDKVIASELNRLGIFKFHVTPKTVRCGRGKLKGEMREMIRKETEKLNKQE